MACVESIVMTGRGVGISTYTDLAGAAFVMKAQASAVSCGCYTAFVHPDHARDIRQTKKRNRNTELRAALQKLPGNRKAMRY